jgi:hypothetical protein
MRRFVIAAAVMAALSGGAYASPSPAPPDAAAQSEAMKQFAALKADYERAFKDFVAAYQAAKTDEDRQKAAALRPKPEDWSAKFKAIAEKNPADPAAAECLAWVVQNDRTPATQQDAFDALLAKHLASPAIAQVCQSLMYSQAPGAEAFLRAVMEKSKDHAAQGHACYSLACFLTRAQDETRKKESESLFERVAAKFGDLKWYGERSLGDKAKGDLFEMRNLIVGKAAPEIVGEDENGKPIKLSDFRGKVVMLDFWGFW